jgi:hypothetical protein
MEQQSIRLQGRFARPEDFAGMVVASRNGRSSRLKSPTSPRGNRRRPRDSTGHRRLVDIVKPRDYATTSVSDA